MAEHRSRRERQAGALAVGIALGVAIGIALGSVIAGIGIGIGIALAIAMGAFNRPTGPARPGVRVAPAHGR